MTENEYIDKLKQSNTKLFKKDEQIIKMSAWQFELQLRRAFAEGRKAAEPVSSLFKQIFG